MRLLPFGAAAWIVEIDGDHSEVTSAWRALGRSRPGGVEDVVAGARSLLVRFSPVDPTAPERTRTWIRSALVPPRPMAPREGPSPQPRLHSFPVVYDGDDVDEVARHCRFSREEVVRRHCGAAYTVAFLGFSPGFAYLTGGDPLLRVPRRRSPRPRVAAGSVAVADDMCAVYPSASPGGWQLLGRTDAVLFDPRRRPPALLEPGDRVRFHPVASLDGVRGAPGARPGPPRGEPVEVIAPGPSTTIQDGGRPGWAHVGVPRAGAADCASFVRANRAVGNPDRVPALEMTAAGPTLRFPVAGVLAVTGGRVRMRIDGTEVEADGEAVPFGPGSVVECGALRAGVRAYLAVAGGWVAGEVLGSASRDTLSGLGPPPLSEGEVLAMGDPGLATGWSPPAPLPRSRVRPTSLPEPGEAVEVEVRPGPRREWIAGGEDRLFGWWRAGPDSDRAGLRLEGTGVPWCQPEEPAPEGMVAGAVQLPAGGGPIVLMANHGATGGYPSVAVVSAADVDRLAQCPPGQPIRLLPGPGW